MTAFCSFYSITKMKSTFFYVHMYRGKGYGGAAKIITTKGQFSPAYANIIGQRNSTLIKLGTFLYVGTYLHM
jgi:hypothetical protein